MIWRLTRTRVRGVLVPAGLHAGGSLGRDRRRGGPHRCHICGALVEWGGAGAPARTARTGADLQTIRTLAVLPFQLFGYPEGSDHLGLGMADALIVKLTGIKQLTVRPTTAVLRYQSDHPDVMAIGRTLQVDGVLTGSVQRDAGRTRVTVQLVRTLARAEAFTLWSDAFTTATNDPFEVQDRTRNPTRSEPRPEAHRRRAGKADCARNRQPASTAATYGGPLLPQ